METPRTSAQPEAAKAAAGAAAPPPPTAAPPASAAAAAGTVGGEAPSPQNPTLVSDVVSDAPTAETAAAQSQGSWPEEGSDRSSAPGFTPVSRPGDTPAPAPEGRSRFARRAATHSDVGRFVSAAPKRPPDSAGDVSIITPMRLFCDLALAGETGLLHFELGSVVKEIFLVGGSPESVSSSNTNERFGEYLVGKQVLRQSDLELALSMLPHYNGKLGDTLVALGLLRPLDVFRLLSEQVRDRVLDVFAWTDGTFAFYRGITNRQENFPLGLDTFEILGASVVNLDYDHLVQRFDPLLDYRPIATGRRRVEPEAFRIGPTPREVLNLLDGERTLRDWMNQFADREELLTFLRSLYLLVETDLAELD
jgi:serine/threonine-protein kinase